MTGAEWITAIFIVVAVLALLTATVRAWIPDTHPCKHPLKFRAEKRRAWREAETYGRQYR